MNLNLRGLVKLKSLCKLSGLLKHSRLLLSLICDIQQVYLTYTTQNWLMSFSQRIWYSFYFTCAKARTHEAFFYSPLSPSFSSFPSMLYPSLLLSNIMEATTQLARSSPVPHRHWPQDGFVGGVVGYVSPCLLQVCESAMTRIVWRNQVEGNGGWF